MAGGQSGGVGSAKSGAMMHHIVQKTVESHHDEDPTHWLYEPRQRARALASSEGFQRFVLFTIIVNSVTLAMDGPRSQPSRELLVLELVITLIFVAEAVIKLFALGKAYFKEGWNILDFVVVLESVISLSSSSVVDISVLRVLRVLRPLRTIKRFKAVRTVVDAVVNSIPSVGSIMAILLLYLVLVSMMATLLWAGLLQNDCVEKGDHTAIIEDRIPTCAIEHDGPEDVCTRSDPFRTARTCGPGYICHDVGENPFYGYVNFDNVAWGTLVMFTVTSLEGWNLVMWSVQYGFDQSAFLFFLIIILTGSFTVVNLMIASIMVHFQKSMQASDRAQHAEEKKELKLKEERRLAKKAANAGKVRRQQVLQRARLHSAGRDITDFHPSGNLRLSAPPGHRGHGQERRALDDLHLGRGQHKADHSQTDGRPPSLVVYRRPTANVHDSAGDEDESNTSDDPSEVIMRADKSHSAQMDDEARLFAFSEEDLLPVQQRQRGKHRHSGRSVSTGGIELTGTRGFGHSGSGSGGGGGGSVAFAQRGGHHSGYGAQQRVQHKALVSRERGLMEKESKEREEAGARSQFVFQLALDDDDGEDGGPLTSDADTMENDGYAHNRWLCLDLPELEMRYPALREPVKLCRLIARDVRADDGYLSRAIHICILLNVVILAMDGHNIPGAMLTFVNISYLVLNIIFMIEAGLKILVMHDKYFRSVANLFDFLLVLTSILEMMDSMSSSVTFLRVLRLLRLLRVLRMSRLARKYHSIAMVFRVVGDSMVATWPVLILLLLFLFVVAVTFMTLVGGYPITDSRVRWDTFGWASVNTFLVVSGERWVEVMHMTMDASTIWICVLFVLTVVLGQYYLLNLVLAIVLEHSEAHMEAQARMNAIALVLKPMYLDRLHQAMKLWRKNARLRHKVKTARKKRTSMMSDQAKTQKRMAKRMASFYSRSGSGNSKRISTRNYRKHMFRHLKRIGSQNEMAMSVGTPVQVRHANWRRASTGHIVSRGDSDEFFTVRLDDGTLVPNIPRASVSERPDKQPFEARVRAAFSRENMKAVIESDRFYSFMVALIVITTLNMMWDIWPGLMLFIDVLGIVVFSLEIVVKMHIYGVFPEKREADDAEAGPIADFDAMHMAETDFAQNAGGKPFFATTSNILDLVVAVATILSFVFSQAGFTIGEQLILPFKALRPARLFARVESLRNVLSALIQSIGAVGTLASVMVFCWAGYAIMGQQLFKGQFHYCTADDFPEGAPREGEYDQGTGTWITPSCADAGGSWTVPFFNFDNIYRSLLCVFIMASLDGWADIMYDAMDMSSIDKQPIENNSTWSAVYFFVGVAFFGFYFQQLFIGIVFEVFLDLRQTELQLKKNRYVVDRKEAQFVERVTQIKPRKESFLPDQEDELTTCTRFRMLVASTVNHRYFDRAILAVVLANAALLLATSDSAPPFVEEMEDDLNHAFASAFLIEMIMKHVVFGFRAYWSSPRHAFDGVITVAGVLESTLMLSNTCSSDGSAILRLVRSLRVFRLARLLYLIPNIHSYLVAVVYPVRLLLNIFMVLCVFLFLYAAIGVSCFSSVGYEEPFTLFSNYSHIYYAMQLLFIVATGEEWADLMATTVDRLQSGSYSHSVNGLIEVGVVLYYVSFLVLMQFLMLNLFVMVIAEAFDILGHGDRAQAEINMGKLQDLWKQFDPKGTGTISREDFKQLLVLLPPPFGVKTTDTIPQRRNKYFSYNPYDKSVVSFSKVLLRMNMHLIRGEQKGLMDQVEVMTDEQMGHLLTLQRKWKLRYRNIIDERRRAERRSQGLDSETEYETDYSENDADDETAEGNAQKQQPAGVVQSVVSWAFSWALPAQKNGTGNGHGPDAVADPKRRQTQRRRRKKARKRRSPPQDGSLPSLVESSTAPARSSSDEAKHPQQHRHKSKHRRPPSVRRKTRQRRLEGRTWHEEMEGKEQEEEEDERQGQTTSTTADHLALAERFFTDLFGTDSASAAQTHFTTENRRSVSTRQAPRKKKAHGGRRSQSVREGKVPHPLDAMSDVNPKPKRQGKRTDRRRSISAKANVPALGTAPPTATSAISAEQSTEFRSRVQSEKPRGSAKMRGTQPDKPPQASTTIKKGTQFRGRVQSYDLRKKVREGVQAELARRANEEAIQAAAQAAAAAALAAVPNASEEVQREIAVQAAAAAAMAAASVTFGADAAFGADTLSTETNVSRMERTPTAGATGSTNLTAAQRALLMSPSTQHTNTVASASLQSPPRHQHDDHLLYISDRLDAGNNPYTPPHQTPDTALSANTDTSDTTHTYEAPRLAAREADRAASQRGRFELAPQLSSLSLASSLVAPSVAGESIAPAAISRSRTEDTESVTSVRSKLSGLWKRPKSPRRASDPTTGPHADTALHGKSPPQSRSISLRFSRQRHNEALGVCSATDGQPDASIGTATMDTSPGHHADRKHSPDRGNVQTAKERPAVCASVRHANEDAQRTLAAPGLGAERAVAQITAAASSNHTEMGADDAVGGPVKGQNGDTEAKAAAWNLSALTSAYHRARRPSVASSASSTARRASASSTDSREDSVAPPMLYQPGESPSVEYSSGPEAPAFVRVRPPGRVPTNGKMHPTSRAFGSSTTTHLALGMGPPTAVGRRADRNHHDANGATEVALRDDHTPQQSLYTLRQGVPLTVPHSGSGDSTSPTSVEGEEKRARPHRTSWNETKTAVRDSIRQPSAQRTATDKAATVDVSESPAFADKLLDLMSFGFGSGDGSDRRTSSPATSTESKGKGGTQTGDDRHTMRELSDASRAAQQNGRQQEEKSDLQDGENPPSSPGSWLPAAMSWFTSSSPTPPPTSSTPSQALAVGETAAAVSSGLATLVLDTNSRSHSGAAQALPQSSDESFDLNAVFYGKDKKVRPGELGDLPRKPAMYRRSISHTDSLTLDVNSDTDFQQQSFAGPYSQGGRSVSSRYPLRKQPSKEVVYASSGHKHFSPPKSQSLAAYSQDSDATPPATAEADWETDLSRGRFIQRKNSSKSSLSDASNTSNASSPQRRMHHDTMRLPAAIRSEAEHRMMAIQESGSLDLDRVDAGR